MTTALVRPTMPNGSLYPPHGLLRYDSKKFKCRCDVCCEARRAYDRKRYEARRDEVIARSAARRKAKREEVRAYQREWYKRNREVVQERSRQWYRENTERATEALRAYRATERGRLVHNTSNSQRRARGVGQATTEQVAARMAYFGNKCAYCGGPFEHVDHVKPLSKGGSQWPSNLRPACRPCNLSKGTKSLQEFLAAR